MRIVLFGTPGYVIPIFEKLARHYEIAAVVTAPPAAVGRDKKVEFSEVDYWAFKKFQKRVVEGLPGCFLKDVKCFCDFH